MAVLLNSMSYASNPSMGSISRSRSRRRRSSCGFFSHVLDFHSFSLSRGFARALASTQITISLKDSAFPDWRTGKSNADTARASDLRLNDAFRSLERS
ncbi:hypothetical protein CRG98_031963, partial [Punica granatum]